MNWVIIMNLPTNLPCWKSHIIYLTNTQQSPKWTPRCARIICSFFTRLRKQLRWWRLRRLQLRLESFPKKVPLCRCSVYDDVSLSLCISSINFTNSILLSRQVRKYLFIYLFSNFHSSKSQSASQQINNKQLKYIASTDNKRWTAREITIHLNLPKQGFKTVL